VTLGAIATIEKIHLWMMRLNEHGCFGTEDCGEVNIYTSTKEIELREGVLLYPNPTERSLYLADSYRSDFTSYSIHSQEGQLIRKDIPIAFGKIDVSSVESGVYIVTLTDVNGDTHSEQVVKK